MMGDRVTTVRMTEEQAVEVELVCRVLDITLSELIRLAIAQHLTERKADPAFQKRLRERIEQDQQILVRLTTECICDHPPTARLVTCPAHPDGRGATR